MKRLNKLIGETGSNGSVIRVINTFSLSDLDSTLRQLRSILDKISKDRCPVCHPDKIKCDEVVIYCQPNFLRQFENMLGLLTIKLIDCGVFKTPPSAQSFMSELSLKRAMFEIHLVCKPDLKCNILIPNIEGKVNSSNCINIYTDE